MLYLYYKGIIVDSIQLNIQIWYRNSVSVKASCLSISMNKILFISLFGFLLFASCKKDPFIVDGEILPFENDNIRIELVSNSLPSNTRDIHFFNSSSGLAVTYNGEIYKTNNSGSKWDLKFSNLNSQQRYFQIYFTDSNIGYVVGGNTSGGGQGAAASGGSILKTIDGGNSWTEVFHLSGQIEFVSITSNAIGELFAISNGGKGRIYKSNDSGMNWALIDSVDFHLNQICFDGNYGFCSGMGGNIIRSNDHGATWSLNFTFPAYYATDIKFSNGIGLLVVNDNRIFRTSDYGNSWSDVLFHQNGTYVIEALTANNYIVFGAGTSFGGCSGDASGMIFQSKNGGEDWTEIEFKQISPIRYSSFYTASEGYVVSGSKLLKVLVK